MFQYLGYFHKGFGVNPRAREDEIDIVAVAAQLSCQPRGFDTFSICHLFDAMPYMLFFFLHGLLLCFNTQKKRGNCSLPERQGFHALHL